MNEQAVENRRTKLFDPIRICPQSLKRPIFITLLAENKVDLTLHLRKPGGGFIHLSRDV